MGLVCLLVAYRLQCRSSLWLSGEWTFTFVFLYSIIMAAKVSLGWPLVWGICSIFPLCMESNALEKSTNNIVASRFFARTPSRIQRVVKIYIYTLKWMGHKRICFYVIYSSSARVSDVLRRLQGVNGLFWSFCWFR